MVQVKMKLSKEQRKWLKENGFEYQKESDFYEKELHFCWFDILSKTETSVDEDLNDFKLTQENIDLLQVDLNNYKKLEREWEKIK